MKNEIQKSYDKLIIRDRSNYQLRHFVIGQHDTPEMQYRQIVIEARDLTKKIAFAELEAQILEKKIDRLEKSGDEIKELKARQKHLSLNAIRQGIESAKEELSYLVSLAKEYPDFTAKEIEDNQKDYWFERLTRQATQDQIALEQGINVGNLQSLTQAGLLAHVDKRRELQQ